MREVDLHQGRRHEGIIQRGEWARVLEAGGYVLQGPTGVAFSAMAALPSLRPRAAPYALSATGVSTLNTVTFAVGAGQPMPLTAAN